MTHLAQSGCRRRLGVRHRGRGLRVDRGSRAPDSRARRSRTGSTRQQAVDFERYVFGPAPKPFVPAHADRAGDPFERLLDVVGVREIVTAEAQLPALDGSRAPRAVMRAAGEHQQHEARDGECGELGDCSVAARDALGGLDRLRPRPALRAGREGERVAELDLAPAVLPVARRDVDPQRGQRGQPDRAGPRTSASAARLSSSPSHRDVGFEERGDQPAAPRTSPLRWRSPAKRAGVCMHAGMRHRRAKYRRTRPAGGARSRRSRASRRRRRRRQQDRR